jgi:hypothetical protein
MVRSKIIQCELCGGQSGRRIDFSLSISDILGVYNDTDVACALPYLIYYCHRQEDGGEPLNSLSDTEGEMGWKLLS